MTQIIGDPIRILIALLIGGSLSAIFPVIAYFIGRGQGRRGAPLPAASVQEKAITWLILTGVFVFWIFYVHGVVLKGATFHWLAVPHFLPRDGGPVALLTWLGSWVLGLSWLATVAVTYRIGVRRGRRETGPPPLPLRKKS